MKSLGEKHRYFDRPKALGVQCGAALETLLLEVAAPVACVRGMALVQALQPTDFLATEGAGEDTQDLYAAVYAGRRLRVGLRPYQFAGQPLILLVAITVLPDGF